MYRGGLDRFKKAQTSEPFAVTSNSTSKPVSGPPVPSTASFPAHISNPRSQIQNAPQKPAEVAGPPPTQHATQIGGGQSNWQPPDWAIEPRPGVYYLEVRKDGEVLDKINLDKRRHIFGRQFPTCDFVLDHQSVSRQHAAVVPHKNGSVFVIDLGSAHGTFVANERIMKEIPTELEVGQSLRFAASTRIYVLRKNAAALFPTLPQGITLPPPPDPANEEAVLAYNTTLNRYAISCLVLSDNSTASGGSGNGLELERPAKRRRKPRVAFRDQVGGELVQVVGISDGADVETDPGPIGVKEGSLVGKYESLVQITVIPKGKEATVPKDKDDGLSPRGVTQKLQQVLNKVKNNPKSGIYDDLYGDSLAGQVGSSWAYKPNGMEEAQSGFTRSNSEPPHAASDEKPKNSSFDDDDDLFG